MNFPTVSYGNNISESSHFGVLGQLDAVWSVQLGHPLCIVTVVYKVDFSQ